MSNETAAGKWHKFDEDQPPRDGRLLLIRRKNGTYLVVRWVEWQGFDGLHGRFCDDDGDPALGPREVPEYWAEVHRVPRKDKVPRRK